MLGPSPTLRQAALLAAFIGGALGIWPEAEAEAAHCHVSDRPVFGLSDFPESDARPVAPTGEGQSFDRDPPEPIRIARHCPADAPGRPSSISDSSGDSPTVPNRWEPDALHPLDRLLPDFLLSKPSRESGRIDRPPR